MKCIVVTTTSTVNIPAGVSAMMVLACGGGAGATGSTGSVDGGGGIGSLSGGAAEFCVGRWIPVTGGGTLSVTIGAAGTGGPAVPFNIEGTDGGATIVGPITCLGGIASHAPKLGNGGGPNPGDNSTVNVPLRLGGLETNTHFGGCSPPPVQTGPGSQQSGVSNDFNAGGPAGSDNGTGAGGNGGPAIFWASGGAGGTGAAAPGTNTAGLPATGYGASGGSSGTRHFTVAGGDGFGGYLALFYR